MKTYGIGIVGAGNISSAYLRLAPTFKGLQVRAIADISAEAAGLRGIEFGVVAMSVDELLGHPDIDVVVNLTIPSAHFGVSMRAIEAGKHVYSEKPFVLSLEEGEALKAAAESRGLQVGSAPDTFLGGAHQQARSIIDGGALGTVSSGTCHVMSPGMEDWHPNPDFFFQPGAGPILDLGPYYITNLIHLLGPIRKVAAFTSVGRRERTVTAPGPMNGTIIKVGTPTTIHGVLEFVSDAIISIGASWDVKAHGHHNMELYGTEGSLFVPDPNYFGGKLEAAFGADARAPVEAWAHPFGAPNQDLETASPIANYRTVGLADMVAAIEDKRPARCGLDVALHAVDVMTALLASGESGEVKILTTTCRRPSALTPELAAALLA